MIKSTSFSFLIIFLMFIITGCSSTKSTPVIPENPQTDINLPANELSTNESSRSILGAWTLSINHETLEATVTPNRSLDRHYNVKYLIPTPEVVINTIYPNYVIDADVTLTNPYTFPAYDIRLIIFTDEYGHFLDNADAWTDLYDIPAGQDINPFKAYAKDQPNRIFEGESQHTENLLVFDPPPGHPIQFAIDASYPGNCEEPYAFENFQQGVLHPHVGANAIVTVDVLDWQNDVSEVYLQCPEITNEPETPFVYDSLNRWRLNLINNAGAAVGEYNAIIYAKSSGSGNLELTDKIKITVSTIGIPLSPVNVGEYRTPLASCKDVCIHNEYLFALDECDGLIALDISNPSEPEIISDLPLELVSFYGSPGRLDCSGNYALVGSSITAHQSIYYVVDISDPFHMGVVGSIELNGSSSNLSYDGDYAVLGRGSVLLVLDLSIPSNPFVAGELEIESNCPVLQGNYVYMQSKRDYQGIVSVVDISDPANPVVVSEYDTMGNYFESKPLDVDGNVLCVASRTTPMPDYSWFVETADVSDPLNPVRLNYIEFTGSVYVYPSENFCGVTASDGYALFNRYFWDSGGVPDSEIHLLDISNSGYIRKRGILRKKSFLNGAISGNFCYVDNFGLGIIDFNDPGNLMYKSGFYRLNATELNITDTGLAYVANYFNSLCVFDVNNPHNPQMLSDYNLDWYYYIRDLDSFNDYIFLSLYEFGGFISGSDRILVLDASDPYLLSEITFLDFDFSIWDIYCNGEYLFVAAETGLLIYDVSNPHVLDLIGSIAIEDLKKVIQQDNYAYATKWGPPNEKFMVIDISDLSNPWIAGETDCLRPRDLEIKDNHAFVLGDGYLKIYDISTPADPVEIAEFEPLDDSNNNLAVSGNYIYLGNTGEIWDITNPQNPQYLSQLDIPQQTFLTSYDCEIVDNYAFSSCGGFGLQVNKLW